MINLNQELENFDAYFFKRHGELPLDPSSEEYANKSYLKHEMFKAWKARAKAQAVPDTHVIVPKEPNDEIIASMKLTWWESDCAHIMKTSVAKSIYEGILKASESGAEG